MGIHKLLAKINLTVFQLQGTFQVNRDQSTQSFIRVTGKHFLSITTPKESSNAYTFVLSFSKKNEFRIKKYFGIHLNNVCRCLLIQF